MPYEPPGEPPDATTDSALIVEHRARTQEREVRLTAQRLLLEHLQPGDDPNNPKRIFWNDTDLDLTGAVIIDFILRNCRVRNAIFRSAKFSGPYVDFVSTTFSGDASFDSANFLGLTNFTSVNFQDSCSFWRCSFADKSEFGEVGFAKDVVFGCARFAGYAFFNGTHFEGDVYLGATKFDKPAIFSAAKFGGQVHVSKETEFSSGTPPEIMPVISND